MYTKTFWPVSGSLHPLPLHPLPLQPLPLQPLPLYPFHKVDQTIRGATCICDPVLIWKLIMNQWIGCVTKDDLIRQLWWRTSITKKQIDYRCQKLIVFSSDKLYNDWHSRNVWGVEHQIRCSDVPLAYVKRYFMDIDIDIWWILPGQDRDEGPAAVVSNIHPDLFLKFVKYKLITIEINTITFYDLGWRGCVSLEKLPPTTNSFPNLTWMALGKGSITRVTETFR